MYAGWTSKLAASCRFVCTIHSPLCMKGAETSNSVIILTLKVHIWTFIVILFANSSAVSYGLTWPRRILLSGPVSLSVSFPLRRSVRLRRVKTHLSHGHHMVLPYVLRLFFLSRHQDEVTSDPKVSWKERHPHRRDVLSWAHDRHLQQLLCWIKWWCAAGHNRGVANEQPPKKCR